MGMELSKDWKHDWLWLPGREFRDINLRGEKVNNTLDGFGKPGADCESQPVLLRYKYAQQDQTIMGLLVKIEADYEERLKVSQSQTDIGIKHDFGMS
jgi:regulator of nonsense transcripts 1